MIVPTHDRVNLLRAAVASVLHQSERDFELIVVDDASEDQTPAYLAELLSQDPRVQVLRNSTAKGGSGARNVGIAGCSGEWIGFLDDDDEWFPDKLARQLDAMTAHPSAVACSCDYVRRVPAGGSRVITVPQDASLRELLTDNLLGGASMCLCSGALLRELGGFDEDLPSGQDLDLWVRLRQRGAIVACNEVLVMHRAHAGPRITSNMQSQYRGARRFYFKHRKIMDAALRRHRVAYICFIMSRQATRALRHRIRYLSLATHNASAGFSLSYAKSSLPRLLRDAMRAVLIPPSTEAGA